MKLILVALLAVAAMPGSSRPASTGYLAMNGHSDVVRYYGVPITLKISDVRSLGLPYKESFEPSEGQELRTVIISAKNHVQIVVAFDHRGDSIDIETTSRRAVDPRGVRIGDTLSRVQKRWPHGKLYYGTNTHEQRYATFMTGTNVDLIMTTRNFQREPSKVFVREIRIRGLEN